MKTFIKNATVVTSTQTVKTNVLVENGKIADIDAAIQTVADEAIDAEGLHLLPGVVDDQVHFREPGLTDKEDLHHASRACAKGGITSFLEMPNTIPNAVRQDLIDAKLELASQKSWVNYGFYIGATPTNIEELKNARRTPGIKIFIGSSTGDLLVDDQDALERIFAETSLPICAHCEDESTVRENAKRLADRTDVAAHSSVRDHQAAVIATRRAIDLATRHKHRFHVLHVSTSDELPLIAKAKGIVTAEVCPHHLFFNVNDYERLGSLVKMNPSIKTKHDNEQLWQALLDGTVQVIATDHAPHTIEEKKLPYPQCPSGLPAVENSLALLLNQVHLGRCSINQVVKWMCENPAKIWNMVGKGRIEIGADADLVLVDMNLKRTILNKNQITKCGWSPWHGVQLTGWPVRTWVMGEQVFALEDGQFKFAEKPTGREIHFDAGPSQV